MYRVILLIFVLLALTKISLRYKDGEMSLRRCLFWIAFWAGAGVLGMAPQWSDYFTRYLGAERGADLFFFLGIVLLAYLVLTLYMQVQRLEQQIARLVRELALKPLNRKNTEEKSGDSSASDQ